MHRRQTSRVMTATPPPRQIPPLCSQGPGASDKSAPEQHPPAAPPRSPMHQAQTPPQQSLASALRSTAGAAPGPTSLQSGSSHRPLHRCKSRRLHQYHQKRRQSRARKAAFIGGLPRISICYESCRIRELCGRRSALLKKWTAARWPSRGLGGVRLRGLDDQPIRASTTSGTALRALGPCWVSPSRPLGQWARAPRRRDAAAPGRTSKARATVRAASPGQTRRRGCAWSPLASWTSR